MRTLVLFLYECVNIDQLAPHSWTMNASEKFCLKWNDFQQNINSTFGSLREDTDFTDVTLVCEDGQQVDAHKVILAASSPMFHNLLKKNKHAHPLLYMRGMKSADLMAILDFLYYGETNVYHNNLDGFLAIAEELKLKGLTAGTEEIQKNAYTEPIIKKEPNKLPQSFVIPLNKSTVQAEEIYEDPIGKDETSIVAFDQKIPVKMHELDEQIKSMMTTSNEILSGKRTDFRICNVCGKKGQWTNIRDHIEANHIEGASHSCNYCEKTFRSRRSLRTHISTQHKV